MSQDNDTPEASGALGIPSIASEASTRKLPRSTIVVGVIAGAAAALCLTTLYVVLKKDQPGEAPQETASVTPPRKRSFAEAEPRLPPKVGEAASAPPAAPAPPYAVGAIDPNAKPIGVAGGAPRPPQPPRASPYDAPTAVKPGGSGGAPGLSVNTAQINPVQGLPADGGQDLDQTRQQLQGTRQQLQGMLTQLQAQQRQRAGGMVPTLASMGAPQAAPQAGQRPETIFADQIANPDLTIEEGRRFTCNLTVKLISSVAGYVQCVTSEHLYGLSRRVLLAPKGTVLEGEYQITGIRPGVTRIPVVWTSLRTPAPDHITVQLMSPAIGAEGESGIGGHVNNRWMERIGASLLLSLIDDAVKIAIADQQGGVGAGAGTVVYGQGTLNTGSRLAEEVLKSTINIPPEISKAYGTVGVRVRAPIDFSNVISLAPARR
jgi:type IV secretion system protein VirB10